MLIDMLMAIEPVGARLHDRHRRALPGDLRGLAQGRGPLRPAGRGVRCIEHERALDRRENCCGPRKVAALEQALDGVDAWITGIRREQSPTRADAPKVEWDETRGMWKFNPLADWSEDDVWRYVARARPALPPAARPGYDSIGCAPCTLPGHGRDGRWAGQDEDRVRAPRVSIAARHPYPAPAGMRTIDLRDLPPARPRVRGDPRDARGGRGARAAACCCSPAARTRSCCCTWPRRRSAPARFPFPVMHVDTGHNFPEVIEFRDRLRGRAGRAS